MTSESNITTFITKSGKEAIIRMSRLEDAAQLLDFINTISLEDTYIRFSGEQQSLEEEQAYLQSEIASIERGDSVKLFCYVEGELAGNCDIHRDTALLTRRRHVGILGLIVAKKFRGEGIGRMLINTTIDEARKNISELSIVKLDCFSINEPAIRLYTSVGFKEVGRFPGVLKYKDSFVDEVVMVLPLRDMKE